MNKKANSIPIYAISGIGRISRWCQLFVWCVVCGAVLSQESGARGAGSPSWEETVGFLAKKIDGHEFSLICNEDGWTSRNIETYDAHIEGDTLVVSCRKSYTYKGPDIVMLESRISWSRMLFTKGADCIRLQRFTARDYDRSLDGEVVPNELSENWVDVRVERGDEFEIDYFRITNGELRENRPVLYVGSGEWSKGGFSLVFGLDESDLAQRISNALTHLMVLNGARVDPF